LRRRATQPGVSQTFSAAKYQGVFALLA